MTYIKINDTIYPAEISGKNPDIQWDRRHSLTITTSAMDYSTAATLFADNAVWSVIMDIVDQSGSPVLNDDGTNQQEEYDKSDWCVAGPITDNRDGSISIKMGKMTELETQIAINKILLGEGS